MWVFLSRRTVSELNKLETKIISINSLKNITFMPIKSHSWSFAPVHWNILLIAIQNTRFFWKIFLNVFKITQCDEGIFNQFWFLILILLGKIFAATRMVFRAFFFVWASVLAEMWHILGLSSESIKKILDRSWQNLSALSNFHIGYKRWYWEVIFDAKQSYSMFLNRT